MLRELRNKRPSDKRILTLSEDKMGDNSLAGIAVERLVGMCLRGVTGVQPVLSPQLGTRVEVTAHLGLGVLTGLTILHLLTSLMK